MTTTELAPQKRPAHVAPRWWYRATWHARQQVVDAENRRIAAEQARIAELKANVERARRLHEAHYGTGPRSFDEPAPAASETLDTVTIVETVEEMLEWADSAEAICAFVGKTPGALSMRMRRAGRPDLARVFDHVRNVARAAQSRSAA